jgi:hypothetical protein
MDLNNPLLNAGFALGGGLGSMPVALPYTAGGAIPGIFGAALPEDMRNKMLGMGAGILGGAGIGGAAMAMQPKEGVSETPQQPQEQSQPQQSWGDLGMNQDAMQGGSMYMKNQYPGSSQEMADKMAASDQEKRNLNAMKLMAAGVQGMGRNQMAMPSGNTAQIIRDQNQFRFAGTPQQQMAQALRNR